MSSLRGPGPRLALLGALLILVAIVSLFLGAAPVAPGKVIRSLLTPTAGDPVVSLLYTIRLPRVLLALLVGAALSISGALLQAFFQNPMAGPYVVGVSSGAGLAAVAVITLGLSRRWGPFDLTVPAAFAGGVVAVALVYALARRIRFLQAEGLLLIGIAVGAIFSALTSVLLLYRGEGTQQALFWMLGSFASSRWSTTGMVALVLAGAGFGSMCYSRHLNALLWGEEIAQSLGTPVRKVRAWVLLLSSLLSASAVAACGVVGFVGLMVPHLARGYLRTVDHRFVIPGSALIGALLVLLADGLARALVPPIELPVGAITSVFGAPFLVWLVVRRHHRMEGS
jgi:iron complex transport system permease protein